SVANFWRDMWCPPLSPYAAVWRRFAGKNWSPSGKSAGRFRKMKTRCWEMLQVALFVELQERWPANSRELSEKTEQEQMTVAVQRLFHLETPEKALAGARI